MLKIVSALKKLLLYLQIFFPQTCIHTCSSIASSESISSVMITDLLSIPFITTYAFAVYNLILNSIFFWTHLLIFSLLISLEVFYLVFRILSKQWPSRQYMY